MGRALAGPGAGWDDHTELLAVACERLGDALYLLQALAGIRRPERPPPIPRPTPPAEVGALVEPPPMSTATEIRAFFHSPQTRVIVTDS